MGETQNSPETTPSHTTDLNSHGDTGVTQEGLQNSPEHGLGPPHIRQILTLSYSLGLCANCFIERQTVEVTPCIEINCDLI